MWQRNRWKRCPASKHLTDKSQCCELQSVFSPNFSFLLSFPSPSTKIEEKSPFCSFVLSLLSIHHCSFFFFFYDSPIVHFLLRRHAIFRSSVQRIPFPPVSIWSPRLLIQTNQSFHRSTNRLCSKTLTIVFGYKLWPFVMCIWFWSRTSRLRQPQEPKKTDSPIWRRVWFTLGSYCSVLQPSPSRHDGSWWIFETRWQLQSVDTEGKAQRNPEGVITAELGAVFYC